MQIAQRLGQVYENCSGMAAQMSRTSSPIAWLTLGVTAVKAWRVADRGPAHWSVPYSVRSALLKAADSAGLGILRGTGESAYYKTEGASIFKLAPWPAGPWGPNPDDIPCGLWKALGGQISLVQVGYDISLVTDKDRRVYPLSPDVEAFVQDCVDLSSAGARVGAVCVGDPGTGKSQAVLATARKIGGRVLRANLRTSVDSVYAAARVLQPDVLIIDDIDRGPTDHALDVIEQLVSTGVAVLATCNNAEAVVAAMKRAGRLDDVRFFGPASDSVRDMLVGKRKLRKRERQALSEATVAQIHRYLEVRDAIGHKRARPWLPEAGDGGLHLDQARPD